MSEKFRNGMPKDINEYMQALAQKRTQEERSNPELLEGEPVDVVICRGVADITTEDDRELL